MKISGSFLTMLLLLILGFTHVLGGPYMLFKIIFWIALLPYIIATLFFILIIFKAGKIVSFGDRPNKIDQGSSTIHVEATIKE